MVLAFMDIWKFFLDILVVEEKRMGTISFMDSVSSSKHNRMGIMDDNVKKISPKLQFSFDEQEELPVLDVDMDVKTNENLKDIKIIEHKTIKKDASTKLF
jgi:hypothetical protein